MLISGQKLPEGADRIWKIFSDASLTREEMTKLFLEVREKKEIPWLAYPEYADSSKPKSMRFKLSQGFFYVNAVEWAASAMEMSVIGGRNVALLVENELFGHVGSKIEKEEL